MSDKFKLTGEEQEAIVRTQAAGNLPESSFAEPDCSAADSDGEELPKEKQALAAGLALVNAKWDGESDFDKGMRLLQKKLGIKR